jgi:hypothetical protein
MREVSSTKECPHHITTSIERDEDGNCFQCMLCGSRVRMPGYAPWSAPRPNPKPLTDEQIDTLQKHVCFADVEKELFHAIVRHIEWEHGISPNQRTVRMGVGRVKAELSV